VIVKQKYKKRPANHLFRRRRHLVIFSQILWSNNRAAQITQCWRSVIVEELNPKPLTGEVSISVIVREP
jgi:hypothetical protein